MVYARISCRLINANVNHSWYIFLKAYLKHMWIDEAVCVHIQKMNTQHKKKSNNQKINDGLKTYVGYDSLWPDNTWTNAIVMHLYSLSYAL